MPTIKGYSKRSIGKNISAHRKAGMPIKQAIAASYTTARAAAKKAGKRPAHLR
jgi:ABC-type uncharacterized transport system permease subunit